MLATRSPSFLPLLSIIIIIKIFEGEDYQNTKKLEKVSTLSPDATPFP